MNGDRLPDDPDVEQILKDYGDYLVGLAYLIRPETGNAEADCNSGFCIELDGRWFWTTAGHVLRRLKSRTDHGQRVLDFRLVDCYGNGVDKNAIPFDYESAWKYWVDSDISGLDFGVVELSEYYKRLLRANGVKAVTQWTDCDIDCEAHFMLGLASDDIERKHEPLSVGYAVKVRAHANAIYVSKRECPAEHRKEHNRFVGAVGGEDSVGDIDGMSGGPVFGILKGWEAHRILAVQSSWSQEKRITFGCPLEVFAPMVQTALRERGKESR